MNLLEKPCTSCGAAAGAPCLTGTGRAMKNVHLPRQKEAQARARAERFARCRTDGLCYVAELAEPAVAAVACPSCAAAKGRCCVEPVGRKSQRSTLLTPQVAHNARVRAADLDQAPAPANAPAAADALRIQCPVCHVPPKAPCRDVSGPRRYPQPRLPKLPEPHAERVARALEVARPDDHPEPVVDLEGARRAQRWTAAPGSTVPAWVTAMTGLETLEAILAKWGEGATFEHGAPTVALDPENPCARCGAPTIRGLNTAFCTLACEQAHRAAAPARPTGWGGVQLDLFQRHLAEAPVEE